MKRLVKISLLVIILFVIICSSLLVYGDRFFTSLKTHTYKNKSGKVNIVTIKNDDISNLDINFKNEGTCDVFVRAYLFIYVMDEDRYEVSPLKNTSISIKYNDEENYWYKGADNYFYYTEALNMGETTREPLAKSLEINLTDEEKDMLDKKDIRFDIVMEAVQVNNNAYKEEWEISDENICSYFDRYISKDEESTVREEKCSVTVIEE